MKFYRNWKLLAEPKNLPFHSNIESNFCSGAISSRKMNNEKDQKYCGSNKSFSLQPNQFSHAFISSSVCVCARCKESALLKWLNKSNTKKRFNTTKSIWLPLAYSRYAFFSSTIQWLFSVPITRIDWHRIVIVSVLYK